MYVLSSTVVKGSAPNSTTNLAGVDQRRVERPAPAPGLEEARLVSGRCGGTRLVNLLADLTDFLHDHRPHGPLTADATEPAWNGYRLTAACSCGRCLGGGSRPWMLSWTCCDRRRLN